ncbi:MAG: amino acid adenylation domain-containing protein [Phototrophicaceae bacterium]
MSNGFPLTQGQRLIWLGQQLYPASPLYNQSTVFIINAALNVQAFWQAFDALVMANDVLRLVIDATGDEPQQLVQDTIAYAHEVIDLSQEQNPRLALDDWLEARAAKLFKLDERLFDSVLLKLADDTFAWYFGQHHLVTDGGTTPLLYQQFSDAYQQALTGTISLNASPAYADYVQYEQERFDSEIYQKARAYWDQNLQQEAESIALFQTDNQVTTRAVRQRVSIGQARMDALDALVQETPFRSFSPNMTYANLFMALMSGFLHRITGHDAIRLGTPMLNRPNKKFRRTPGLFMEVVSMFLGFDEDETLSSLVQKVATESFEALQNMQAGITSADNNRAFDVLVNYVTTQYADFADMPTEAIWLHPGHGDSHHQLRLQIHDMNQTGIFELLFDFNTSAFSPAEQQLMIDRFLMFVDTCIAHPTQPLHQIAILTDAEIVRNQQFNQTDTHYPSDKTLIELFEKQAHTTPDVIALSLADTNISYRDLSGQVNAFAQTLRTAGVNVGTTVPICIDRSFELIVALLAVMKVGAIYVPLEPSDPDQRHQDVIADCGDMVGIITDTPERFSTMTTWSVDLTVPSLDSMPSSATPDDIAYMLYTSGSTGKPKGVKVTHRNLSNYLSWAAQTYDGSLTFALYSSVAVDMTVTTLFTPLIAGGHIRIYPDTGARGTLIRDVFAEDAVDVVKLTPSHLTLVQDMPLNETRIQQLIVGGEIFTTSLAQAIYSASNGNITQYNEYGPTEATVACMIHTYDPQIDNRGAVPIGVPIANAQIYILDKWLQPVMTGIQGEIYIGGAGVAAGYHNRPELSAERFIDNPFVAGEKLYKSGDVGRWLRSGELEYLGRADRQVKIRGVRIELDEIEALLAAQADIQDAVVMVHEAQATISLETDEAENLTYCSRCGLSSNYPGIHFDDAGVCNICLSYDTYKSRAEQYFRPMEELEALAEKMKAKATGDYDCIALMSGGKDSTYMVYRLANMGLRVLAFTLDNGYIAEEAMANVRRVTKALGVDHVFAETPHMNSIFVDSLRTHANVCNGCFKTIYTLAGKLAQQKGIGTIVTGLSRGQFFETRLTEEVFTRDDFDNDAIDQMIADARRAYHQRDDLISRSLDVDIFREQSVVDAIDFVDFYRYCDVSLQDIYDFLIPRGLWVRPSDTGRSTNCLINEAGIFVHKKRRGYHNYALPYSWDVRVGHKQRDEALEELDDDINEANVKRILREIGYTDPIEQSDQDSKLVIFYTGDAINQDAVRDYLAEHLPTTMLPDVIIHLDAMPLRSNGKVDYKALQQIDITRNVSSASYVAPSSELETELVELWQDVLHLEKIGVHDNFFNIGGHSLPAIRITTRISALYDVDVPLDLFFAQPTIEKLAETIEDLIMQDIDNLSDEDVLRLLGDE